MRKNLLAASKLSNAEGSGYFGSPRLNVEEMQLLSSISRLVSTPYTVVKGADEVQDVQR